MPWFPCLAVMTIGFGCGSIPFGVLFARLRGVNLREVGSGNIGATNAARALGKGMGVLVLLCDAGKAAGPLLLLAHLRPADPTLPWLQAALGFGAVTGHMYSPWLRLRGGKGVATGFGAFLALCPPVAGIAGGVWATLYALTRTSSVGSLVAITAVPVLLWLWHAPTAHVVLGVALHPLIVWRHRDNIRRLLRKEESRL